MRRRGRGREGRVLWAGRCVVVREGGVSKRIGGLLAGGEG